MLFKEMVIPIFKESEYKSLGYFIDGDLLKQHTDKGDDVIITNLNDVAEVQAEYTENDDSKEAELSFYLWTDKADIYFTVENGHEIVKRPPPQKEPKCETAPCSICDQKYDTCEFLHMYGSYILPPKDGARYYVCHDCKKKLALEYVKSFGHPRAAIHSVCWILEKPYIHEVVASVTAKEKNTEICVSNYLKKLNLRQYQNMDFGDGTLYGQEMIDHISAGKNKKVGILTYIPNRPLINDDTADEYFDCLLKEENEFKNFVREYIKKKYHIGEYN